MRLFTDALESNNTSAQLLVHKFHGDPHNIKDFADEAIFEDCTLEKSGTAGPDHSVEKLAFLGHGDQKMFGDHTPETFVKRVNQGFEKKFGKNNKQAKLAVKDVYIICCGNQPKSSRSFAQQCADLFLANDFVNVKVHAITPPPNAPADITIVEVVTGLTGAIEGNDLGDVKAFWLTKDQLTEYDRIKDREKTIKIDREELKGKLRLANKAFREHLRDPQILNLKKQLEAEKVALEKEAENLRTDYVKLMKQVNKKGQIFLHGRSHDVVADMNKKQHTYTAQKAEASNAATKKDAKSKQDNPKKDKKGKTNSETVATDPKKQAAIDTIEQWAKYLHPKDDQKNIAELATLVVSLKNDNTGDWMPLVLQAQKEVKNPIFGKGDTWKLLNHILKDESKMIEGMFAREEAKAKKKSPGVDMEAGDNEDKGNKLVNALLGPSGKDKAKAEKDKEENERKRIEAEQKRVAEEQKCKKIKQVINYYVNELQDQDTSNKQNCFGFFFNHLGRHKLTQFKLLSDAIKGMDNSEDIKQKIKDACLEDSFKMVNGYSTQRGRNLVVNILQDKLGSINEFNLKEALNPQGNSTVDVKRLIRSQPQANKLKPE